jgi:hypothetical protein
MADDIQQPQDQATATGRTGVQPPPIGGGQSLPREVAQSLSGAPQQGILGLGGPGQGGEGGLIQALMQQRAPQANPWLAAASGMQQGLAGKTGSNPYLDSQQKAAEQQQSQQRSQYEMLAKAREQKMKQDQANEAMELEILGKLKDSSDPGAVEQYQRGMSDWARRHNVKASPEWFASKDKIPAEDLADINNMIVAGVPDAEIFARYPKLKPTSQNPLGRKNWLDTQRAMLKDPYVREKLGYKQPEDPGDAVLKKDAERTSNWIKAHPDFKDGDVLAEANARFRKITGREITTSTKEDAALLSMVSQDARQAVDAREDKRKADERAKTHADIRSMVNAETIERVAQNVARGATLTDELGPLGRSNSPEMMRLRAEIQNRVTQIQKDAGVAGPEARAAYQASRAELAQIQRQRGPMLAYARTADKNISIAENLSAKVDRTGSTVLNRWLLAGRKATGDPDVAAFNAAVRTAINEFAKVTSSATGGGVTSDAARADIEAILNTAYTPEQFQAVVRVLRQEMDNRIKGYDEQIEATKRSMRPDAATPGDQNRSPLDSPGGKKAEAPKAGQTFDKPMKIRKDGKDYNLAPGSPLPPGYEVVK